MTLRIVAWAVLAGSFLSVLAALQIGERCASDVGPWSAAGLFAAWITLVLDHERRHR